ncbi:MAG: peptidase [Flaviaesturariibacter sp.]|nr:peptidase [Flaviaesturariibacter sp.]
MAGAVFVTGCEQKVASLQQSSYFDKAAMDTAVSPGDDFFAYANGAWAKTAKIPDEYSSWGSFTTLYDDNLNKLKTLLEGLSAKKGEAGSLEQKAGDFYASGMDTIAIEKLSYQPLKPWLQRIDAIKDHKELMKLIAEGYQQGAGDLLGFFVGADEKNSAKNIAIFYQAGLTFPEKGYYTRTDSTTVTQRKKLTELATSYFKLTGADAISAAKWANAVLALEMKIAASHRTPVELRDPSSNYNKLSVDAVEKMAPTLGWKNIFSQWGIATDSINLGQPQYFKALSTLLASEPIDNWKAKLKFDYINDKANLLSNDFRVAKFNFSKELSGQKKMPDRWKQVVGWSDSRLKDVVGQLYVKEYFPPEAMLRMDTLVNNLQVAFKARIQKLDWMTDSTKQKANIKLDAFLKKIGYPTKWKDYTDVTVSRTDLFGNINSVERHDFKESLSKIDKPVDRTEWGMTPSTVNAYYNPTFNEIVFPAGILQFPFFHLNADDAINYGAIGMVIGHEMTHGFDDQGSQYDAEGNMKNWWQPADATQFKAKAANVVTQYNGFTMFDSLHVNGALTLGENLADLGGLNIAYDAFKLTKQGQSNEKIDGLTPDQRFFLGFAQIWRTAERPEYAKMLLNVDPHSPNHFRVNGPLANFTPFYTTFHVTEKNKLFRKEADRIKVW